MVNDQSHDGGINPFPLCGMMSNKHETVICHIYLTLGEQKLNWEQQFSGLDKTMFELRDIIEFVDNNWLLHLRKYMIQINAKIELQQIWKIKKLCEHGT